VRRSQQKPEWTTVGGCGVFLGRIRLVFSFLFSLGLWPSIAATGLIM